MKRRRERPPLPAERPLPTRALVTRREAVLLGVVLAVGVLLRMWALSQSAVEHFDEGVYASNIFFDAPEFAYPLQRFYAPPLLPALIEAFMIVGLPPKVAALLPSFLAGCGTIVALWWFGRSWFGPPVGICAATLVALNDFHVMYSATALTDVLLGLWLILAVDAIGRSLLNGDLRWAVGAGLYTGLAWWTKYNGWLPLAIEGAALPVMCLFLRPPRKQFVTWLTCFAVTGIVAAAVWSPYYLSLQSSGGYGPIAANHAKYVVGLGGWFDSASRQIANQYCIESPWSAAAVALAMALSGVVACRTVLLQVLRRGGLGAIMAFVALWGTSFVVTGCGALTGMVRLAASQWKSPRRDETWHRRSVGVALVVAWFGGLLLATPCYTPYPRLVLPWLMVAWIGAALNFDDALADFDAGTLRKPTLLKGAMQLALILSVAVVSGLSLPHLDDAPQLGERRGLLEIARRVRTTNGENERRVVYVYGEPALYFQLCAIGEEIVAPIQNIPTTNAMIDGRPAPTFLVTGPHSHRDPQFQSEWSAAERRWELVQSFDYQPSVVVWLDLHDPRKPLPPEAASQNQVRLYRLR